MPYWAFAWPGGQGLARFLLEHPDIVKGKSVLNIGSGCALESIAAVKSGARVVHSNDIDPLAAIAGSLNAQLSNLTLEFGTADLIGTHVKADIILAGDVWYDAQLANQMVPWLRKCAVNSLVLIGDARRVPLDNSRDETLFTARAPFDGDIRGLTLWDCRVLKLASEQTSAQFL